MSDYAATKERHVIGVLGQTRVLFWKNSLLFRRNVSGTLAEILVAFLFVLILLAVRYFADTGRVNDQTNALNGTNPVANVVDFISLTPSRTNIFYYPPNDFTQDIVGRARDLIAGSISNLNRLFIGNGNNCV
jgi:hypothetical protein